METNINSHQMYMSMAIDEAKEAAYLDEVPVGAVIISENNEIIARAKNNKESVNDPCGHAEIIALRQAAKKIKSWRLLNSTVYVTLEPCPMCLAAMVQARIGKVVFGAYDKKGGAISLGYKLFNDPRLNHRFKVIGGVMHYENSKIISDYFKSKRSRHTK